MSPRLRRCHAAAQAKFAALSTSAKLWSDQTGATLRSTAASHFGGTPDSPTASSTLKEIARGKSGLLADSSAAEGSQGKQADAKEKTAGLGHDQELEAYLHVRLSNACILGNLSSMMMHTQLGAHPCSLMHGTVVVFTGVLVL